MKQPWKYNVLFPLQPVIMDASFSELKAAKV